MRIKSIISGSATYVPGVNNYLFKRGRKKSKIVGQGTQSAEYCYSVWLKHLSVAFREGALNTHPSIVAELGPGDSLGVGLAALITGAQSYYAFDVVNHTGDIDSLQLFDDLVTLFRNRADLLNDDDFSDEQLGLRIQRFPKNILSDKYLESVLNEKRIMSIRNDLVALSEGQGTCDYVHFFVPWNDTGIMEKSSVDMLISHCVMEHVDDLGSTYKSMYGWLKQGGFMSHLVDFKCHGHARMWNGHWGYSDILWKLMRGKRPYFINRAPCSFHVELLMEQGFEIICSLKQKNVSGLKQCELDSRFSVLSEEDITTSAALILGRKKLE